MKIVYSAAIMIAAVTAMAFGAASRASAEEHAVHQAQAGYYCPMHPNYTSDKPGACPICGMDLVKKQPPAQIKTERKVKFYRNPMDPSVTSPVFMKDAMGMDYIPVYEEEDISKGVLISPEKQQLIGVKTAAVKVRPLIAEVRASASVVLDQELYDAQKEYVNTDIVTSGYWNTAHQKLLVLGMSEEEILQLRKRGWADTGLIALESSDKKQFYRALYRDVSWVYAEVFENEAALVKRGQTVELSAVAFPGERFHGVVTGIAQVIDSQTRTVRVRIKVDDNPRRLRSGMFMTAILKMDLGQKLAVPAEAVMDSGVRKIVYVVQEEHFSAREVRLGVRAGGFSEVLNGLREGETVVTSGNFLIDAESKLKGALENAGE